MCRRNERFGLVATNVARLCRDRLCADRGRMPGFANDKHIAKDFDSGSFLAVA
jgi:hypothetical protein